MTNSFSTLMFLITFFIVGLGNAKDSEFDTYLSMKLTHTIYKAVLYTHIEDIDTSYKPFHLAHKYYLLNFLSKWEEMINSRQFESNDQIFNKIRSGNTFLSKYYYIWYGIHSVTPKTQIALGGQNNVFLKKVYNIDKSNMPLETKILDYLDAANLYLITNSNDHRAAGYLASAFQTSEILSIKEKAKAVLSNASFQNKLQIANMALLVSGFGAKAFAKPLNSTMAKAQSVFTNLTAQSKNLATKSINALKNVKPIYHTTAISSALQGGLLFYNNPNAVAEDRIPENLKKLLVSVSSLNSILSDLYSEYENTALNDFSVNHTYLSEKQVLSELQNALSGQDLVSLDDVILSSEKHLSVDNRTKKDFLGFHIASHEFKKVQSQIDMLFNKSSGVLTEEDIESFREIIINGPLKNYKRDHPSLMPVMFGWGGNCVSQTLAIIAWLKKYQNQLPNNSKLLIALFSDHIEPVIYDQGKTHLLMSGDVKDRSPAPLYTIDFIYYLILKNYDVNMSYEESDFLYLNNNSSNFALETIKGFSFENIKKRFLRTGGVLETISMTAATGSNYTDETTPQSATVRYKKSSKKEDHGFGSTGASGSESGDGFGLNFFNNLISDSKRTVGGKKDNSIFEVEFVENQNTTMGFDVVKTSRSDRDKLVISDKDLFLTISSLNHKKHSIKMFDMLSKKLIRELRELLESPVYYKHYLELINNPESVYNINKEDVQEWIQFMKKINHLYRISSAVIKILVTSSSPFTNPYSVGQRGSVQEEINKLFLELRIIEDFHNRIENNPLLLVKSYLEGSEEKRYYLLSRFILDSSNTVKSNNLYSFFKSPNKITTLIYYYSNSVKYLTVKHYLDSIPKVKIKYSVQQNNLCLPDDINLPKAYWGQSYSKDRCSHSINKNIKNNDPANKYDDQVFDTDIEAKPEALLELSILYGAGFHLWDQTLKENFRHSNISNKVIIKSEYIDATIQSIIRFNSQYISDIKDGFLIIDQYQRN